MTNDAEKGSTMNCQKCGCPEHLNDCGPDSLPVSPSSPADGSARFGVRCGVSKWIIVNRLNTNRIFAECSRWDDAAWIVDCLNKVEVNKIDRILLIRLLLRWYYGYHSAIDAHKKCRGDASIKSHFIAVYRDTENILGPMRDAGTLSDETCHEIYHETYVQANAGGEGRDAVAVAPSTALLERLVSASQAALDLWERKQYREEGTHNVLVIMDELRDSLNACRYNARLDRPEGAKETP